MIAIENADIYSELGVISDKCLLLSDRIILDFCDKKDIPHLAKRIDLKGMNLAAGFIDLQVNGGGDILFNDIPSVASIETISKSHRTYGTTSFLPTLITASETSIENAISATKACLNDPTLGVLGLHLEGPFIESSKAGVHDKSYIRHGSDEEINRILKLASNVIKVMTVAPEAISNEQVRQLCAHGVRVLIGHTNATYECALNTVQSGATGITHLFNAMSQLGSREPGVVGLAFSLPKLYASVIADGHHVAWPTLFAAKKAMGEALFLVTDAMPVVGGNNDHFELGPYSVSRIDNRLTTQDGVLAGSCLDMASAVRNCVQKAGIALPEALRMASLYPARFLALDKIIGSIKKGKNADLVVFDNQVSVIGTFKAGIANFTI